MGTLGFAIGVSGFEPVWDQVGERGPDFRGMQVTAPAVADGPFGASGSPVQGGKTHQRGSRWCGPRM
ncbi:MAG: hypothetical protein CM15mP74_08760 [Halieaceae bacterium]|nr:MAG: hypothetical protein CM15mP74_08760 [Halieaceae bacterium]